MLHLYGLEDMGKAGYMKEWVQGKLLRKET